MSDTELRYLHDDGNHMIFEVIDHHQLIGLVALQKATKEPFYNIHPTVTEEKT